MVLDGVLNSRVATERSLYVCVESQITSDVFVQLSSELSEEKPKAGNTHAASAYERLRNWGDGHRQSNVIVSQVIHNII